MKITLQYVYNIINIFQEKLGENRNQVKTKYNGYFLLYSMTQKKNKNKKEKKIEQLDNLFF